MKGLLTASLALVAAGVMAQENGNRDEQNRVVRGPYETNRFFDNIFIGVAGGVNIYHGENDSYGKFGKRLAPALDVNVGKWFTPSVGARIGYSGINAKGWTSGQTVYAKDVFDKKANIYNEKFGVSYLHTDFLWNFSNAVSGYKETRTWNFVPFFGAGWARSYGNGAYNNEFAMSIGLLNNIRLCNLLDLTLEARHMFVNQRFDGVSRGSKGEGMTSVTMGLTFKLNRRNFKRAAAPVDVTPYLSRIKALESDNTTLAGKNKTLADENTALRNRKPETVTVAGESKVSATPVALFFQIGKATLDKKELTNLDFYVKNALQADRNKTFTLYGGADKATGTAAFNQKLSEKRMQYVYDLLVNKYGISKDRLKTVAEGDRNNRFPEPELNRTVIIME
ncbi:OmpA family protein [Alistipes onderdonkii]|uniref:OmpA family protein n=1 Tax=Alistipes onderdonkii TaxID=328813 RepID=UPI001C37B6DC|nr:OmpA family protein [Alistipes onderdonkii]MBV4286424.1 OmpA family protein [Alistipes onderdonkii]MBV4300701.1 OmpA family protein [Alistipes onderdonkii]MBV4312530.1 OmpA family protein [Alistipes onderdonkii]MBV4345391.1 OmpA family protein [Alistipes onderdonkii]